MLLRLADEMKSSVLSQWISNRMRFFDNRTSKDPATVAEEAITNLDKEWHSPRARLMVVPGKSLLSAFNTELQNKFGISITSTQIIHKGTSNNCRPSSGAPNLSGNDSALFPFRFYAVHPKEVRDCHLRLFFEVSIT